MFSKNSKFLIVDDSLNLRRMVADSLKIIGYKNITMAEDANEAMGKLTFDFEQGQPFDVVLSDLNMPGPSGLDFLKMVRASKSFGNLPFILITTENEKGAVIEAAMSGVSGYIVKPFSNSTLSQRLSEAYKKHFPEE